VSAVLERLVCAGFVTVAPPLLDSFRATVDALHDGNLLVKECQQQDQSARERLEGNLMALLGDDGVQLLTIVLSEMTNGSRHLMDTLQHCDLVLKMLLTGQQVSSPYPFHSTAFDVRTMLQHVNGDNDLEALRFVLEDVHEASLTARQQFQKAPGIHCYRICFGCPEAVRVGESIRCLQRPPIVVLRDGASPRPGAPPGGGGGALFFFLLSDFSKR
jgi:hypothetical protein